MLFRKATEHDLDGVMRIVAETAAEMRLYGSDQWDDHYPARARFQQDIACESLYVAESDGETLGFVAADFEQPTGYAGLNWSRDTPPMVVHRLAVASRRRGVGIASFLERNICELALRANHDHLRIDTYSANRLMQAFLTRRGYVFVGEMSYRDKNLPFYCYEKIIP